MEPTARFGRRTAPQSGWRPEPAAPVDAPQAGRRVTHWLKPHEPPTPVSEVVAPDVSKGFPLLTFGIIVLLAVIFWQQLAHAFLIDRHLNMSVATLLAEGADGRDLARDQGWRVLTAPLLHAGLGHIVGNCVSLVFIGWYLERLIGHAWFAIVYFVCGLGGEVASLLLMPPDIVAIGASGAIMGLFGAAFVCSFHVEAHAGRGRAQWRIMRWSLPSLIPTQGDGTNYIAHAGGATAGVLMGFLILTVWPETQARPRFGRAAGGLALAGLAASALALCLVAAKYPTYQAATARFIPASQLSDDEPTMAARSGDLVDRYPQDPRSHYYRAVYWLRLRQLDPAINELKAGIDTPPDQTDTVPPSVQPTMRVLLGMLLVATHRQDQARDAVGVACDYPFDAPRMVAAIREFRDTGVCPWTPGAPSQASS
ncbi:rhomboid family intramembrane serine protease [Caulobacter sp. KR2-114]|uniref:rhomboid family intramembrane serine protease n=1 Tax=Caulobacter sp. KR2-114 TaxID=3400912 RepID=UPI003C009B07